MEKNTEDKQIINIKMNRTKAFKLMQTLQNLFIDNFFELSKCLDELINFDNQLELKNLITELIANTNKAINKSIEKGQ